MLCFLLFRNVVNKFSLCFKRRIAPCITLIRLESTNVQHSDLSKIRNIGIIAHIDAGKTTTTERMLYYSGLTHLMGEVHDGNTVMDFMPLEREKGITITSAAITFQWKKHRVNLIDTPGHVDFTFEVERVLAVLEGAVIILDSSAGVEVQTLKVWAQANRYEIPCIVYLNKMDKPAANIDLCMASLGHKLKVQPLMLHMPIGIGKSFEGVVDILTLQKILWENMSSKSDGASFKTVNLSKEDDGELYDQSYLKREILIESIIDLDDVIAEKYLNDGINSLSCQDLQFALRRITLKRLAVPVLCGSSYRNIGVQLLIDAVLQYLPAPNERNYPFVCDNNELCAFVFKITHSKNKDPLTFLRVYSGSLKNGQKLHNINREGAEKIAKLSIAYADNFKEVPFVNSGNIAVVSGLKNVTTGDFLFSSSSSLMKTKQILGGNIQHNLKYSIQVPTPVFFCTIEPPSISFQKSLESALQCLQREDPTFCVEVDETLGQTILMGMGELHIDIIKERIRLEYGINVYLGPLLVAYRETIEEEVNHTHILDKVVGGSKQFIKILLKLYPKNSSEPLKQVNVIITKDNDLGKIRSDHFKAINAGAKNALNNGPLIQFPVINVAVDLLWLEVGKNTSYAMISAATSQCIIAALKNSKMYLLEPVMKLSIIVDKGYAGRVLNDLSQKRSQIINMESRQDVEIIESKTPLAELRGYSTNLRAITSGTCSFTMELDCYEKLDQQQTARAIEEVTGFAPF